MKQIKFRAWDKENKNMLYPKPLSPIKFMLSFSGEFGWFDLDKQMWSGIIPKRYYELMQYTGLKDSNGTEIYEGDIVKWTRITFEDCSRTVIEKTEEIIGEVYWAETMWGIRRDGVGYLLMPYFVESDEFEVIGNVFQDPELLEGEECYKK